MLKSQKLSIAALVAYALAALVLTVQYAGAVQWGGCDWRLRWWWVPGSFPFPYPSPW